METKQDFVEPLAGYSHHLGYYLGSLVKARAYTKDILADLTPAELAQRLPDMYSIGALTLHLGEAEYYWIQEVVGERALTEEEMKWAHFFDTIENDVDRGLTVEHCTERIDAISAKTRELLKNYTDGDLDKVYIREYNDVRTEITLRSILHRLIDHEAHHRGQMSMIKRMIRGGEMASS